MDKTIEMALEAGFDITIDPTELRCFVEAWEDQLKAFEALVRADEREVRSLRWDEYIAKAIEAEREACAKVADYYSMHDQDTPADIAAAIRARGQS
jgi:hypothetical protein